MQLIKNHIEQKRKIFFSFHFFFSVRLAVFDIKKRRAQDSNFFSFDFDITMATTVHLKDESKFN